MRSARDGNGRATGRHRGTSGPVLLWVAVACAAVWGCDSARPLPEVSTDVVSSDAQEPACHACHGSEANAAPPRALNKKTATTERGVGAHQIHLSGSADFAPVACESCHVVPAGVYVPGHLDAKDGKATVTFAGAGMLGGLTPTWDPDKATCANAYCHGAGLKAPGKHSTPKWTQVDGTQRSCDSCHGAPPPAPHPNSTACEQCHAATAGPGMKIAFPDKHLDGKVDVVFASNLSCNLCHGDPPPAPKHPQATACNTCHATTVDAQKQLLAGGTHANGKVEVALTKDVACGACHGAPPPAPKHPQATQCNTCHAGTVDAAGLLLDKHRNGTVEVDLTADVACNACHGNPPPAPKHPQQGACTTCHASTVDAAGKLLPGGLHRDGKVDYLLTPATCGTCHGAPPAPKHPQMNACEKCHTGAVDAGKGLLPLHRNGQVDVKLPTACDACHGKAGSAAPPPDHNGNTDPALPTVGAHAAHLTGKIFSKGGITCQTCHQLPATVDAPGHLDGSLQTVTFPQGKAAWKGSVPSYDPTTQTCSGVYCHGATMDKPGIPQPKWTQSPLFCDSCHGNPPPLTSGHPQTDPTLGTKACNQCHKLTVKPDGTLDLEGGHHADGMVNP